MRKNYIQNRHEFAHVIL